MTPTVATTILIVDDSPEDRHTYTSFLRANRDSIYTFLEADSAEEGLKICRQAHLDCIILDFELPDMSGLEFLARLTEDNPTSRPPVVMVTGRGNEAVAVAALKAGASDYLVKSDVSVQSVFRATHNALEISQLNRSLAQEMRDREKAEADLRESESRYRLLVESVRDYAIMMLDTGGKISSWNAGARRLFGYHDDEIIGAHVRRLYPLGSEREQVADSELRNASLNGSHTAEGFLVRKDGTQFWSTGSISPVFDRWARLCGYSKVVKDLLVDGARNEVTPQKEASAQTDTQRRILQPLKNLRGDVKRASGGPNQSTAQWVEVLDTLIDRMEKSEA